MHPITLFDDAYVRLSSAMRETMPDGETKSSLVGSKLAAGISRPKHFVERPWTDDGGCNAGGMVRHGRQRAKDETECR